TAPATPSIPSPLSHSALQLAVTTGASGTTAAAVQTNLQTIGALANNVTVTGPNGGPFTITFKNGLAYQDVAQIVSNSSAVAVATPTNGGPTVAQVQTALNSIAGLSGNVTVSGFAPNFTLTYNNGLAGANVQQVIASPSAGVTASVATATQGGGPFTITFQGALFGLHVSAPPAAT